MITAAEEHAHKSDEGDIHVCEFASGRLFRAVHLPVRVDPDSAKATFRNGMLHMTARAKTAEAKKIAIEAA